jgi:drug/metabolite transporter (DMT)-like permease
MGFLMALPLALVPRWFGLKTAHPVFGPFEAMLALAVGVLAFGGHYYFTRGYRGTSVQLGTAMSLSVPVVAALAGALLLGEHLGVRFLVGGSCVLAACFCIGWLETRAAR